MGKILFSLAILAAVAFVMAAAQNGSPVSITITGSYELNREPQFYASAASGYSRDMPEIVFKHTAHTHASSASSSSKREVAQSPYSWEPYNYYEPHPSPPTYPQPPVTPVPQSYEPITSPYVAPEPILPETGVCIFNGACTFPNNITCPNFNGQSLYGRYCYNAKTGEWCSFGYTCIFTEPSPYDYPQPIIPPTAAPVPDTPTTPAPVYYPYPQEPYTQVPQIPPVYTPYTQPPYTQVPYTAPTDYPYTQVPDTPEVPVTPPTYYPYPQWPPTTPPVMPPTTPPSNYPYPQWPPTTPPVAPVTPPSNYPYPQWPPTAPVYDPVSYPVPVATPQGNAPVVVPQGNVPVAPPQGNAPVAPPSSPGNATGEFSLSMRHPLAVEPLPLASVMIFGLDKPAELLFYASQTQVAVSAPAPLFCSSFVHYNQCQTTYLQCAGLGALINLSFFIC